MIHVELESIASANWRILDVGGKDGNKVANVPGQTITADFTPKQAFETVEYVRCDGRRMPFSDDIFDLIHCQQVLEHIENKSEFIDECRRVLKPNGIAHFSFPNRLSPIHPHSLPRLWSFLPRIIGVPASKLFLPDQISEYYKNHSFNLSPIGARRLLHAHFNDVTYVSIDLMSKYRNLQRGADPDRYTASQAGKIVGEVMPVIDQARRIPGMEWSFELLYPDVMYRCSNPK